MGVVYLATDPAIGRDVAIKVIRVDPYADANETAQLRLRLSREASAAGRLSHSGIVTVYQLGTHEETVYIAMEFLQGTSLEKLLEAGAVRDFATSIALLQQVADALDYAHSKGVVHRDIKPGNILVSQDGRAKITDFGIAKIRSQNVTRTGLVMGTPEYMSPEQIKGETPDGRSDQFSLAVLAYLMLSGRRPFEAPTLETLITQIVHDNPTPIHEANRKAPASAAVVFSRALAKSPSERFESCRDFVEALNAAVTATGSTAVPSAPRPVKSRKLVPWALAFSAVLAGGVLIAWAMWPRGPQVPQQRQAPPSARVETTAAPTAAPETVAPPPQMPKSIVNEKDGLTYVLVDRSPPGFYLGQTEVTADAYARFRPASNRKGAFPATGVTWHDASAYCEWAGGRLPSEAEWEQAATGGSGSEAVLSDIAWFSGNSRGRIHEAGVLKPNGSGLHDMQGNVWEWVADTRGPERILRGGSALSGRQHAGVSARWALPAGSKDTMIGFRCALAVKPPVAAP